MQIKFGAAWLCLCLAGLVPAPSVFSQAATTSCDTGRFKLRADFAGGASGQCEVVSRNQVVLTLRPENTPINPSPWYSFVVTGHGRLHITLAYGEHRHRYQPKLSSDGQHWRALPSRHLRVNKAGTQARMRVRVQDRLYISGQENLPASWYATWTDRLLGNYPGLTRFEIGQAVSGTPLVALATNPGADNAVIFVGRQHPPEVTGALAMVAFVEALLQGHPSVCTSQQPLCRFYRDTNIVFVPLANPDGVDAGHWRHNLNGVDLNRDWRAFTQPETQAMRGLITAVARAANLRLFLDFHSTFRNVFYTQDTHETTAPPDFARQWLSLPRGRHIYALENAGRDTTTLGTSKNYMHSRFGIPAITYELGDETDRDKITHTARALVHSMIANLYPYGPAVDLLITGGMVAGKPVNVAVNGNRIVGISQAMPSARRVINAAGLVVTAVQPGEGLSPQRLASCQRGRLQRGQVADIALWNPSRHSPLPPGSSVPIKSASQADYLVINGELVIDNQARVADFSPQALLAQCAPLQPAGG